MRKDGKKKQYLLCMAGMAVLVAASLFGPRFIFAVWDYFYMSGAEVKLREQTDVAGLNVTYEEDLYTRLDHFVQENNCQVTAIDYMPIDTEKEELLQGIFEQSFFWQLNEFNTLLHGSVPFYTYQDLLGNAENWKKYIIYGDDFSEGIALMAWYVDVKLADGTRIECLADTESYTIYSLQISFAGLQPSWQEKKTQGNQAISGDRAEEYGVEGNTDDKGEITESEGFLNMYLQEFCQECTEYSMIYYDTLSYRRLLEKSEGLSEQGAPEEDWQSLNNEWTREIQEGMQIETSRWWEEKLMLTAPLSYESGDLHLTVKISQKPEADYADISFEIREIAGLIPELAQK